MAIVIEIAGGAAEAAASYLEAGIFGDVRELSVAEIVEETVGAIGGGAYQEKIGFAVAIVIEEAGAGARPKRGKPRPYVNERLDGLWGEANGDGRRSVLHGTAGKFSEREAALIAVACAELSGDVIGGHFLKFGEMLFGG